MKINMNDCLQLSAVFLQLEYTLALLCGQSEDLSDKQLEIAQKESALLQRCANLVVREIASDYVHLNACDTFVSEDGHISYSSFSKQPIHIYSVKKNGENCRFKLYPNELITESGSIEASYTYLPQNTEANGILDFEEGKISPRIIAYGTAAEYCIICGMYEEAVLWDKRYKDSLMSAARCVKPITVAKRRWY